MGGERSNEMMERVLNTNMKSANVTFCVNFQDILEDPDILKSSIHCIGEDETEIAGKGFMMFSSDKCISLCPEYSMFMNPSLCS